MPAVADAGITVVGVIASELRPKFMNRKKNQHSLKPQKCDVPYP